MSSFTGIPVKPGAGGAGGTQRRASATARTIEPPGHRRRALRVCRVSGAGILVLVLVGLLVVGGIAYLQYLAAKRRREEFAALAARNGWAYAAEDDRWVDAFEGAPFGRGHTRRAINVL